MKKLNKKGFTIVELVIVIAVIAILAAVLIPTFSGIIAKANQSAAQQEVTNAYKEAYALALADDGVITTAGEQITAVEGWDFTFTETEGVISVKVNACPEKYSTKYQFNWEDGKFVVAEGTTPAVTEPTEDEEEENQD